MVQAPEPIPELPGDDNFLRQIPDDFDYTEAIVKAQSLCNLTFTSQETLAEGGVLARPGTVVIELVAAIKEALQLPMEPLPETLETAEAAVREADGDTIKIPGEKTGAATRIIINAISAAITRTGYPSVQQIMHTLRRRRDALLRKTAEQEMQQ